MSSKWDKLIFYYHPIFQRHLAGLEHPENPERLNVILNYLKAKNIWEQLNIRNAAPAAHKWIITNHSEDYLNYIARACQHAPVILDGGDTLVTHNSFDAALHGVGACLSGIDDLMRDQAEVVFCAVRPPGHHAEYAEAMGFCLFNNVAIAARYAIDYYSLQRIFILDWDVHHGNGTQHSFYDFSEVFFCSIHQWSLYPGTGSEAEKGRGVGKDYTLNIPLPAGMGDKEYLEALKNQIIPMIRQYRPDLLLISAGFDAHKDDPLADMKLSTNGFSEMTRMLREEMKILNGGKILSVLEGGYHQQNLAESVLVHLEALIDA